MSKRSTKEDIKQFLEDLGFTVSLDYEREPMGTMFADIHEHIHTIDGNLSTYQAFRALEIELMVIVSGESSEALRKAVNGLKDEFTIYQNNATDNTLKIIMRGAFY
jgi:hypothetical protein